MGPIIKQELREVVDSFSEEDEISSMKETAVPREDVQLFRRSLTKISLLNKPPRLGLSKLYRSSTSLHDVSILEAEDSKYQQEVFIIQKEE